MKRALLLIVLVTAAGVIAPLALAGEAHGRVLLAYILVLSASALLLLIDRLRRALPQARLRRSARPPAAAAELRIDQFERIRQAVASTAWREIYIFDSLRPIVREIVAASLMRQHGIDLDRSPLEAHSILGDGYAWDLARPDRMPPRDLRARGWSSGEIDKLLDELEAL